jgi:hypothetical protein
MKFKPTPEQIEIIKMCALHEGGDSGPPFNSILLEPGIRCNIEDTSKPTSINAALVTNHADDFNDTDLHDYGFWSDFRAGVELDPNGRGIFDFYIRWRGDSNRDLFGNVTVYVNAGRMHFIEGYGEGSNVPLWTREGGYRADVKVLA